jgi:Fe-S-cluster-containing hydrogenase component 2
MEAIDMGEETASVLRNRCIGCGLCVTTCPQEAIRLQEKPQAEKSTPPIDRRERFRIVTEERSAKD